MIVTIRTTSGQEFTKQLDYPKGDPRNPLSDAEIEQKFAALAGPVLSRAAQKKVREVVWNLERLESVSGLMKLLKARRTANEEERGRAGNTGIAHGANNH